MPQLIHEITKSTPEIHFDTDTGIYLVQGIATPLNAFEYFSSPVEWLKKNEALIENGAVFRFNLPYFNSASAKGIILLLQALKVIVENGNPLKIVWYVEPDDEFMIEAGESYKELLGMNIVIEESGE